MFLNVARHTNQRLSTQDSYEATHRLHAEGASGNAIFCCTAFLGEPVGRERATSGFLVFEGERNMMEGGRGWFRGAVALFRYHSRENSNYLSRPLVVKVLGEIQGKELNVEIQGTGQAARYACSIRSLLHLGDNVTNV